jgi:HSP20 family protein
MAENPTKVPVKTGTTSTATTQYGWRPFESLRRDIDRLFEDFGSGFWRSPFPRSFFEMSPFGQGERGSAATTPAVDVTETDKAYEISAELPGMDEKNIEVKFADGVVTIKGERQEEREEQEKGYHLRERSFGSFQRAFQVPEGVDADKIQANFKQGLLTLTLPKTAESQKAAKKIEVKSD